MLSWCRNAKPTPRGLPAWRQVCRPHCLLNGTGDEGGQQRRYRLVLRGASAQVPELLSVGRPMLRVRDAPTPSGANTVQRHARDPATRLS